MGKTLWMFIDGSWQELSIGPPGPAGPPGSGGTVLAVDSITTTDLTPNIANTASYSEDYLDWSGGAFLGWQDPDYGFEVDPTYPNWITWDWPQFDPGSNLSVYHFNLDCLLPYEPQNEPLDYAARKFWDVRIKYGFGTGPTSVSGGWSSSGNLSQGSGNMFGGTSTFNVPATPNSGTLYNVESDQLHTRSGFFQLGYNTPKAGISFQLKQIHPRSDSSLDRQTGGFYSTLVMRRIT